MLTKLNNTFSQTYAVEHMTCHMPIVAHLSPHANGIVDAMELTASLLKSKQHSHALLSANHTEGIKSRIRFQCE